MKFHNSSLREGPVKVSLIDASNLSKVANKFGARSSRDARRRSDVINRPVVGSNPDYYIQEAGKVVLQVIREDKTLSRYYALAGSLCRTLSGYTGEPYAVGVKLTDPAADLLEVSKQIDLWYAENELQLPLEGKWLERAVNISAFALRENISTNRMEHTVGQLDVNSGLFPGYLPNNPLNSVEYWSGLNAKLQLAA